MGTGGGGPGAPRLTPQGLYTPPRQVQGGRGLRGAGCGRSGSGSGARPWVEAGTHPALEQRALGLRAGVPGNSAAETQCPSRKRGLPLVTLLKRLIMSLLAEYSYCPKPRAAFSAFK